MTDVTLCRRGRSSLGLIGIGAFGEFCIPHLRRHFDLCLADVSRALAPVCDRHDVPSASLEAAAGRDIVVLAMPLTGLRQAARRIAPHLRPGCLVIDVCSVKVKPLSILAEELPACVDIVGTHPLFGPQSGRAGIAGQRVALCPVRGRRGPAVRRFLARRLGLDVIDTDAQAHDRQMAVVQALTHVVARSVGRMGLPQLRLKTTSFTHLESIVDLVGADSDELFRTIVSDNPFAGDAVRAFRHALDTVIQGLDVWPAEDRGNDRFGSAECAESRVRVALTV